MRALIGVMLVGCYRPVPATDVPCSSDFHCPGAQRCDRSALVPVCIDGEPSGGDAPVIVQDDAPTDGIPIVVDAMLDGPKPHAIPPGAVLWYRLDDPPGNGVDDAIGTHQGMCTSGCPGTSPGVFGSSYVFSGQTITTPGTTDLQPNTAFTLAAWARLDSAPSGSFSDIACKRFTAVDASYCLTFSSDSKADFYTNGSNDLRAPSPPALGTWHHYAMTWAKDGQKIGYIDGAMVASAGLNAIPSDNGDFVVGGEPDQANYILRGAVDDVVFYDRVLGAVEITQLATP